MAIFKSLSARLFVNETSDIFANSKTEPSRICYLERAKELANKRMFREATVVWEGHCAFCLDFDCTHRVPYIGWLINDSLYEKAVKFYQAHQEKFLETEAFIIEESFAALLLSGEKNLQKMLPVDSALLKHGTLANQALLAYLEGEQVVVESTLKQIPFRSSYRYFRQVLLQASQLSKQNEQSAHDLLEHIPKSSSFFSWAKVIWLNLVERQTLREQIPTLNQVEFNLLNRLKGWSVNHQKLIEQGMRLGETASPQKLFETIQKELLDVDRAIVRRMSYQLLPFYKKGIPIFEKVFGKLTLDEKGHIETLTSLSRGVFPPDAWLQYETKLGNMPADKERALKRAIILRYVANIAKNDPGAPKNLRIKLLESSIELDPNDQTSYIDMFHHYQLTADNKKATICIDKALKAFPRDRDILKLAIEFARETHCFARGIELAKKLIELDPINRQAQHFLSDLYLDQTKALIGCKKFPEAYQALMKAIDLKYSQNSNLDECVLGLWEYTSGLKQAGLQRILKIYPMLGEEPIARFRLRLEATEAKLSLTGFEKELRLAPLYFDKAQFIKFSNWLKIHFGENKKSTLNMAVLKGFEPFFKKNIFHFPWLETELVGVCDVFLSINQFSFVQSLLKEQLKSFPNSLWLNYYSIYAKVKAKPKNIRDKDFYSLERLHEKAEKAGNDRLVSLINMFLIQMQTFEEEEDEGPNDENFFNVFESIFNELKPKEKKMLEELANGGIFDFNKIPKRKQKTKRIPK